MRHSNNIVPLRTKAEWDEDLSSHILSRYEWRRKLVTDTAWCILTQEVADVLGHWLKNRSSVIEVFAGTGYVAEHLRRSSGLSRRQFRSYDACVSHWRKSERRNYGFTKSGCFNVNLKKAEVVLMTWPNYADKIASRIVRKMAVGQFLIYNGESKWGCTGDDAFFEHLESNFEEVRMINKILETKHVTYDGMHDEWKVYKKVR